MSPNDERRREAGKWLREAVKDLHGAKLLLNPDEPEPSRSLFFSQHAAEKAAKALLTSSGVSFRKTHALVELGLQCGDLDSGLIPIFSEAADLTDYASVFRYPDAPYEPDVEEALRALEVTEKLYVQVRARVESPEGSQIQGGTGEISGDTGA